MQVSFYENIDYPPAGAGTMTGIMQQRRGPMSRPANCRIKTARVQLPGANLARHFGKKHRTLSAPTCTQPGGFIVGIGFFVRSGRSPVTIAGLSASSGQMFLGR
jgi:hypothetical protein